MKYTGFINIRLKPLKLMYNMDSMNFAPNNL
jgi:hypothetical protein